MDSKNDDCFMGFWLTFAYIEIAKASWSTWRSLWHWRLLCYSYLTDLIGDGLFSLMRLWRRRCPLHLLWHGAYSIGRVLSSCDVQNCKDRKDTLGPLQRLRGMVSDSFGAWYCSRRWLQMCSYFWRVYFWHIEAFILDGLIFTVFISACES